MATLKRPPDDTRVLPDAIEFDVETLDGPRPTDPAAAAAWRERCRQMCEALHCHPEFDPRRVLELDGAELAVWRAARRRFPALNWRYSLLTGGSQLDAERRARKEAERKEREQREARRPDYARAWAAAEAWGIRWDPTSYDLLRRLQIHVVDLALDADPPITSHWLTRDQRSTALVGERNAIALTQHKAIVCPPVVDWESSAMATHEIAHGRDKHIWKRSIIGREVFAWRWAREHSMVWNQATQGCMVRGLRSYLAHAKDKDILDVIEAERLMSGFEYRAEKQRRLELELGRRR